MTKFILAGGCDSRDPEYISNIARIIQADVENPRILSCWFSNPDETAQSKFEDFLGIFNAGFSKNIIIQKAEKDTFIRQLAESDVLYLHGGETTRLIESMSKYDNLIERFERKIIIGSSAGANYLAKYGYSPRANVIIEGSGMVDQSVVVHYGSEGFGGVTFEKKFWDKTVDKLMRELPISSVILLPEGQFTIFSQ